MTELPTGTVAFLMTDIEGSTRLVRDLGPAFPTLLGDHFGLLGGAIEDAGGTLVSSEGDALFAVFPTVRQAILAAVAGQRALAAHAWPDGVAVRVRMGINAGEAIFGGRDYTGLEVHRTARIMAAGHGGQVLLSASARALAEDVGEGITFRAVGSHQLRDMPGPEELVQLMAPGLTADFPPLHAQPATVPNNLPTPLTRFVGRAAEVVAITAALAEARLLTLTGPGGTGKTRLAIEVGRAWLDRAPDGVWFVGLDVLRDSTLVLPAIARSVGAPEAPGVPPLEAIANQLAGRRTLIVLDNLEQVIGAAPDVAALLEASPGLLVLATSREPLAIAGERVFAVPPLAVPDVPVQSDAALLAANDCVALFVERARAVRADFSLSDVNARAVAGICRRLDGLPLAIELAAARVNLLAPDQILARMDHRLTLLASSRRDLTDRQRTLRGAIDWSYDLLAEPERAFFRRFAVFSGGADLDTAQPVIDPDLRLGDGLELAAALIDRSLLRSTRLGEGSRLEMLETLREYAADQLAADPGEAEAVGRRHAEHFRALAEASEHVLTDPNRDAILDRLERELPNFRAAVAFCLAHDELEQGIRMAAALVPFWHTRGHLADGGRLLGQLVDATAGRPARLNRIMLLMAAGEIATWNTDYIAGQALIEEGLALAIALDAPGVIAGAHQRLGWATMVQSPEGALGEFAEAIRLARPLHDDDVLRNALQGYGITLIRLGDWDAALPIVDESIALAEEMGDPYMNVFGFVTRGMIRLRLDDRPGSLADARRALGEAHRAGSPLGIGLALDALALVALHDSDPTRAATLAAGAARLREEVGGGPSTSLAGIPDPLLEARKGLDEAAFDTAAAHGRGLGVEQLVSLGLGDA